MVIISPAARHRSALSTAIDLLVHHQIDRYPMTREEKAELDRLRIENEELRARIAELEAQQHD